MRIRFNPYRAGFFLALALLIVFIQKVGQLLPRSYPTFHLDQQHMIAALAVAGITVVGVAKLILRHRR